MSAERPKPLRFAENPYRRRVKSLQPQLELYLLRDPPPADAPVYVFQHTMKTGGTAFRTLLYENLEPLAELEVHDVPKWSDRLPEVYAELVAGLTPRRLERLYWVAGHSACHLIPFLERPVRPVTIVRDPLDRVLSRYFFGSGRANRSLDSLRDLFAELERQSGSKAAIGHVRGNYTNPQSRTLLDPHFKTRRLRMTVGLPPDADEWRERLFALAESYTLLVQDRLAESTARLAHELGWAVDTIHFVRVNEVRPRAHEVDDALRQLVNRLNWLDLELYRHAVARLDRAEPAGAGGEEGSARAAVAGVAYAQMLKVRRAQSRGPEATEQPGPPE